MPAYRSTAEAEIRASVVAWLRSIRPGARIIHEINACAFGNRVDVMAVERAEILSVEIKSERDKLDRAASQIAAMAGCSHHVFLAIHRCHLAAEIIGNPRTADGIVKGAAVSLREPAEARGAEVLVWPEPDSVGDFARLSRWQSLVPDPVPTVPLPADAIGILWAEELRQCCEWLGVSVRSRANMETTISALRWSATGGELTKGICRALRRRACKEADPPIFDEGEIRA